MGFWVWLKLFFKWTVCILRVYKKFIIKKFYKHIINMKNNYLFPARFIKNTLATITTIAFVFGGFFVPIWRTHNRTPLRLFSARLKSPRSKHMRLPVVVLLMVGNGFLMSPYRIPNNFANEVCRLDKCARLYTGSWRYSVCISTESLNAASEDQAIGITASSTLSAPMYLNPNEDLDVSQGGRQIQIVVETQVPSWVSRWIIFDKLWNYHQSPAPATITVSNLTQTYDSTAKAVTVTTNPSGLANTVTYNGSALLPINAGTYPIVATVTNPNYIGTSTASMMISPATVTVTANPQTKVYDGLKLIQH